LKCPTKILQLLTTRIFNGLKIPHPSAGQRWTKSPKLRLGRDGPVSFSRLLSCKITLLIKCLANWTDRSLAYGSALPDEKRLALLDQLYEISEWNWDSG
jgi:hypothetical protein